MRRKSSKLVLISAGAALAWFLDPVSGSDRRRQVADRLTGLVGGATAPPGSDPTGGAAPPAAPPLPTRPTRPTVQPPPISDTALRADFDLPSEPDLAQAVEAATGGEKVLRSSDGSADGATGQSWATP